MRDTQNLKKKAEGTIIDLEQKCNRAEESNKMVSIAFGCCAANSDLNLKFSRTFECNITFEYRCKIKLKTDLTFYNVRSISERKRLENYRRKSVRKKAR